MIVSSRRAALVLAMMCGTSVTAQTSEYRCGQLDLASALPSIEGRNGVFYRVLADLRMRHPMEEAAMQQLADLSAALAAGGTTLIYVTVPTKSQAMPQFLPPAAADYSFDSATAVLVYDDIIARLSDHGVLAPDILAALSSAPEDVLPFFQADFHWTSDGARLAAAAIASVIKAQPEYGEMTVSQYQTVAIEQTTAFSTMRRTLQTFCKDELPRVEDVAHVTSVVAGDTAVVADIFAGDDDPAQIVLVGTSFSDSPLGNFAGFLSEYSGLDVVNYAVSGGNQFGAMTSYLTSRDFAQSPPRFLIWENPVYSNLAQYGPDPMDELIAAAGQTCSAPLPIVQSDGNSLTADLTGLTIGRGDVIRADLGTDGPRTAAFSLTTATGIIRNATMIRSDRMLASGQFYKPLGSIWHPDLTAVTVTFDRPVSDLSTLSLCQMSRKDTSG